MSNLQTVTKMCDIRDICCLRAVNVAEHFVPFAHPLHETLDIILTITSTVRKVGKAIRVST